MDTIVFVIAYIIASVLGAYYIWKAMGLTVANISLLVFISVLLEAYLFDTFYSLIVLIGMLVAGNIYFVSSIVAIFPISLRQTIL